MQKQPQPLKILKASQMESSAKSTQHTTIAHTVFQRSPRLKGEKNVGIGTKDVCPGFKTV